MKSILSLAMFAGVSLAQSAQIGLPATGQKLTRGSDVIVQVQRPVCFLYFIKIKKEAVILIKLLEHLNWFPGNGSCNWYFFL